MFLIAVERWIARTATDADIATVPRLGSTVPRRLIAESIDIIVFISGRGLQRRIASIARVVGLDPNTGSYALADLLNSANPQGE